MKYRNSGSNMAAANTFEVVKETQEIEHADRQRRAQFLPHHFIFSTLFKEGITISFTIISGL
jgi:hypothetical protein